MEHDLFGKPVSTHRVKVRGQAFPDHALALGGVPSSLLRGAFLLAHLLQDLEVVLDILVRVRIPFAAQTRRHNRGGDLVSIGHVLVSRCLN
jgi:hypothetical protein